MEKEIGQLLLKTHHIHVKKKEYVLLTQCCGGMKCYFRSDSVPSMGYDLNKYLLILKQTNKLRFSSEFNKLACLFEIWFPFNPLFGGYGNKNDIFALFTM